MSHANCYEIAVVTLCSYSLKLYFLGTDVMNINTDVQVENGLVRLKKHYFL